MGCFGAVVPLAAAALVISTGFLLVLPQARAESEPSPMGPGGITTLRPDCQSKCGGIQIPYPFGIGGNCSLSEAYLIDCRGNSSHGVPFILSEVIMAISVPKAQARIRTKTSRICSTNHAASASNWWIGLAGTSLTISEKENRFTAIGCNTLALIRGSYYTDTYTVGCLSTCPNGKNGTHDGECSGIGCCQTSIPVGLNRYYTTLKEINNNTNAITDIKNSQGLCGYAFLAEKGNYTFNKTDLDWSEDQYFSVVLDWSIANQTCEEAQKNQTGYACKSSNSYCRNSNTSSVGYICNCTKGYEGNPYLQDGCQDINECNDNRTYPCYGVCTNFQGGYNCSCPLGMKGIATLNTCTRNYRAENNNISAALVVAVGVGSGLGFLLLLGGCILLYKKSTKQKLKKVRERHFRCNYDLLMQQQLLCSNSNEDIVDKIKFFSLKDLEKATNKFDSSRIVGQGGHGTVYKGLIDLRVVAIKRSQEAIQIEIEQFLNEIILLSQISHRNVVKLIGCCLEAEVPLLVYEFISNGTLSDHLHVWNRESPLSWDDRLRIAVEISRALVYLHSAANVSIFHRDIKSSNILLDENLTVKVSDFGASRFITFDQTHVSTNIQGTLGYLDPEYMHTGRLTEKSDVYSLGVILVELLTGEKPTSRARSQEERNLIGHFVWALNENKLFQVVESLITKEARQEEVEIVSKLAMACLSLKGEGRPTMKDVEVALDGLRKDKERKKKKKDFKNNEEVESLLCETSAHYRNESTSMTRNATSLEGPVVPSQSLFR